VDQVWTDEEGHPAWAVVGSGFLGIKQSLVPLEEAAQDDDGLVVAFDKEQVEEAPKVDPLVDETLTIDEVLELHEHYGLTEERDIGKPSDPG